METAEIVDPEFVQRAVDGILAVRSSYAELIGFYGAVFAAQEAARPRVRLEPFLMNPDLVRVKLRDGFPLIQVSEMRFDPEISAGLFEDLRRIAVDRSTTLSASAKALEGRPADIRPLFRVLLEGDEDRLSRAASELGAEPGALSFFLYHSLRPSLCRCSQELSGFLADAPVWEKGYCPICGSPAALAELDSEGRRSLNCSFCWQRWHLNRVVCPFCANSDPGRLSYFFSEEEKEYRVDVCAACRRHIKTVDSRNLSRPLYPPLEQIASLHLDLKAAEAGYGAGLPDTLPAWRG